MAVLVPTARVAWKIAGDRPGFGGLTLFVLPALERLYSWLIGLIILAIVLALFIIFVSSRLDTTDGVSARWGQLKRLSGLLILAVAFNHTRHAANAGALSR